ncbi:unannotated protein [freshwater metagenome]|uniref:Unannotated protein n=1 Tax=freshwater metagenome TaxID=449393 RepID=A0A6J7UX83_9ZZZZ
MRTHRTVVQDSVDLGCFVLKDRRVIFSLFLAAAQSFQSCSALLCCGCGLAERGRLVNYFLPLRKSLFLMADLIDPRV